jgi:hypothetical protein
VSELPLDPFPQGGWIEAWLQWVKARSPDYVDKKIDVWKVLGSLLLNTLTKVVSDVEPVRTGNMLVALTGPSGSIKSWALTTMRFAAPLHTIPAGTPEYLLSAIAERRVGVVYEPEIGTVLKAAESKSGYMRAWGDNVDKIYDLDALEAGRKISEATFIEPRSYYVSVVVAGTPKDYGGMFNLWPGLKRRFLVLNLGEVAPPKLWKPSAEGAEALAKLHSIGKALSDRMVVLKLENVEVVNELARFQLGDPVLERKCFEYAVKMLYACIIDSALQSIVGGVVSSLSISTNKNVKVADISLEGKSNTTNIPSITDDTRSTIEAFRGILEGVKCRHLSVLSVDCADFATDIKILSALLSRHISTLPTLEAPVREYADFAEDVNDLLKSKGYTTLREICRRRNWPKNKAQQYLVSMAEAGYVIIRYIKQKQSTVIIDPTLQVCGACRSYDTNECKHAPVEVLETKYVEECFKPYEGEISG